MPATRHPGGWHPEGALQWAVSPAESPRQRLITVASGLGGSGEPPTQAVSCGRGVVQMQARWPLMRAARCPGLPRPRQLLSVVFIRQPGVLWVSWACSSEFENSWSLLLHIFLFLYSFFTFWYFHYIYVTPFHIVPHFLDVFSLVLLLFLIF